MVVSRSSNIRVDGGDPITEGIVTLMGRDGCAGSGDVLTPFAK
jgi:hypothetical protein